MLTDQKLSVQVNNAIKIIGDDHILCIIGNLRDGGLRFNELQLAIKDINSTTLTDRLKKHEHDDIIVKKKRQ